MDNVSPPLVYLMAMSRKAIRSLANGILSELGHEGTLDFETGRVRIYFDTFVSTMELSEAIRRYAKRSRKPSELSQRKYIARLIGWKESSIPSSLSRFARPDIAVKQASTRLKKNQVQSGGGIESADYYYESLEIETRIR